MLDSPMLLFLLSTCFFWMVLVPGPRSQVPFQLATLTYSPKSYGFLTNFSLIMLDSLWLLLSLSTWKFFVLDGFRGSS